MCVCACVQQNHTDQCFEMLKKQLSESNESVKKLREDIGSQVRTSYYILSLLYGSLYQPM